ncbi:hypothetical protein ACJX0J_013012, partial [Zea mays]
HAKYFHICYTSPMFTYQGQEHFKPFPLISEIKVIFGGPPLAHRKQTAYVPGSLSLSSILGNCLFYYLFDEVVLYFFPLEDAVLHAKYFHICYTSPMFEFLTYQGQEHFKPFPLISEIKVIFGGPPLAHRKQTAYVPGSLSLSSI